MLWNTGHTVSIIVQDLASATEEKLYEPVEEHRFHLDSCPPSVTPANEKYCNVFFFIIIIIIDKYLSWIAVSKDQR